MLHQQSLQQPETPIAHAALQLPGEQMTRMAAADLTISSTSTWSDALDRAGIQGVVRGLRHVVGPLPFGGRAVTARQEAAALGSHLGEAFDIAGILEAASEGDVLVIDVGGAEISSF